MNFPYLCSLKSTAQRPLPAFTDFVEELLFSSSSARLDAKVISTVAKQIGFWGYYNIVMSYNIFCGL
jgi:hypothetical protein